MSSQITFPKLHFQLPPQSAPLNLGLGFENLEEDDEYIES